MVNALNSAQVTSAPVSNNGPRYLENLSKISDSCDPNNKNFGKYTDKQIADATNKLNAREYSAFGHFAGDASSQGIKKLAEAYINYMPLSNFEWVILQFMHPMRHDWASIL